MIVCGHCGTGFEPRHPKARFCSSKCRAAAWQRERARTVIGALEEAERAIRRAWEALARRGN